MTDNLTVISVLQQLDDRIATFAGRRKPENLSQKAFRPVSGAATGLGTHRYNLLTPGSVFTSRSLRHDGGVGGQDLLLDQPLQTV